MLYHNHGQVPVYIGGKLIHPNDSRDVDPAWIPPPPSKSVSEPPGEPGDPPQAASTPPPSSNPPGEPGDPPLTPAKLAKASK